MKVTVCEMANPPDGFEAAWEKLAEHVAETASDFVLLGEMPFYRWLPLFPQVDTVEWRQSVQAHERWIDRLGELGAPTVVSSRPVIEDGVHRNVGFIWRAETGAVDVHTKYYLPEEEGFWEASWYERGDGDFSIARTPNAAVGFLICTELWFTRHAREYGKQGAHIIVCPRATPSSTAPKWIAGGQAAAVVSGAFCLSSNFAGKTSEGADFAGVGWIIEPEEGKILGLTSSENPFVTVEVDLTEADRAKTTYPRYVQE